VSTTFSELPWGSVQVDVLEPALAVMNIINFHKALVDKGVETLTAPVIFLILQNAKRTPHYFSP
jgi:hypothetical protein